MKYTLHTDPLRAFPVIAKLVATAKRERRCLSFHFGLDVELGAAALCVIIDGGQPRDCGKHTHQSIVALSTALVDAGHQVFFCEEACGFGPYLQRRLSATGATAVQVAPENLGGRRKTDKIDACQLAQQLYDFCVHRNRRRLRIVRDLGDERRRRRALGRQRAQLQKSRQMLAGNGRGLMHDFGFYEVPEGWWGKRKWLKLRDKLLAHDGGEWLLDMLTHLQATIQSLNARMLELEQALAASEPPESAAVPRPKGLGDTTHHLITAETGDWGRFRNRSQASSFTGLCSSERSSALKRRQGGIDRLGNHRLRKQLVEAVWRLRTWNPGWRGFKKFPHVFAPGARIGPAARKKAVVACARMLYVDLWRLNTGQTTLQNLGLIPATQPETPAQIHRTAA
jgi:transposase